MAYSIPMSSNGVENQRPNNLYCLHLPIRTLHLPSFHQIIIGNLSNNKVWFDRPSLYHLRHSDWLSISWSATSFSRWWKQPSQVSPIHNCLINSFSKWNLTGFTKIHKFHHTIFVKLGEACVKLEGSHRDIVNQRVYSNETFEGYFHNLFIHRRYMSHIILFCFEHNFTIIFYFYFR